MASLLSASDRNHGVDLCGFSGQTNLAQTHPSLLLPCPSILPHFHLPFQLSFFLFLTFPPFSSFLPLSPSFPVLPLLPIPFHRLSCFYLPSFLSRFSSSQCWSKPCANVLQDAEPRLQDPDGGEMAREEGMEEEKEEKERSPWQHTHTSKPSRA